MTASYTNMFRYEFDVHQVRLIFFDQHRTFTKVDAQTADNITDLVGEVVMTRQSFAAFMETMERLQASLPPIAIPGQPYPPQFVVQADPE